VDDLLYSDYNSYPDADRCLKTGWLKTLALSELQPAMTGIPGF